MTKGRRSSGRLAFGRRRRRRRWWWFWRRQIQPPYETKSLLKSASLGSYSSSVWLCLTWQLQLGGLVMAFGLAGPIHLSTTDPVFSFEQQPWPAFFLAWHQLHRCSPSIITSYPSECNRTNLVCADLAVSPRKPRIRSPISTSQRKIILRITCCFTGKQLKK